MLGQVADAVLDEVVAQYGGDRDFTVAGLGLRVDLAFDPVPSVLDANHAAGQVDVRPVDRLQLAAAQPGVERRRPQCAVALGERGDQHCGLGWLRDPVAAPFRRRQVESYGGVDCDLAEPGQPTVDRSQRHERVADRRCVELGAEIFGEPVQVGQAYLGGLSLAEPRQYPQPQRLLIAPERRGLVRLARAVADRSGARALEPFFGVLGQRRLGRRAPLAGAELRVGFGPPQSRLGERAALVA